MTVPSSTPCSTGELHPMMNFQIDAAGRIRTTDLPLFPENNGRSQPVSYRRIKRNPAPPSGLTSGTTAGFSPPAGMPAGFLYKTQYNTGKWTFCVHLKNLPRKNAIFRQFSPHFDFMTGIRYVYGFSRLSISARNRFAPAGECKRMTSP